MNEARTPFAERDLLDDVAEGHDVVGHRQGVGVTQVDLLLAGCALMVAELHRDAHLLECVDGVAAEVRRRVVHGLVEVATVVGGYGGRCRRTGPVRGGRTRSRGGARSRRSRGRWPSTAACAARGASRPTTASVGHRDVTEHACRVVVTAAGGPRQHLERRRIGTGDHVGFRDPRETLDGRAVEADALLERTLEFGGCDGHRLEVTEDVGEPQPDEADVAFFQRAQDEFLLPIHARSVGSSC